MASQSSSALSSLLPTLNDNIPPELVQLSSALLAQSRTRAAALKPEEEIARPYACAEIACKRLRVSLKLPPTNGRPPCPPRVYKKLLTFLEGALPARLPARKDQGDGGSVADSSPAKTSTRSTPRKTGIKSTLTTPTVTRSKGHSFVGRVAKHTKTAKDSASSEAPVWVMPLIRRLCATFSTPLLPPHVYTGVCVVLKLSGLHPPETDPEREDGARAQVHALIISLYFTVFARMQRGKITSETYMARSEKAVEVAKNMAEADAGSPPMVTKDDVDDWVNKINKEGWARGQEWWESVPENIMEHEQHDDADGDTGDAGDDALVGRVHAKRRRLDEKVQEDADPDGVLLPGLGTMMQDAVDWLSEERRLDYLDWRENISGRLRAMEKKKGKARTVAVH